MPERKPRAAGSAYSCHKATMEGAMNIHGISGLRRSLVYGALMLLPIVLSACGKGGSSY